MEPPGAPRSRAWARDLFLRCLGLIFCAAFLSVLWQLPVLFGSRGLLPADAFLTRAGTVLGAPTVFWLGSSDGTLTAAAGVGALLGVVLAVGVAPRAVLAACWGLYLSFVTVGQDFFSFQWDNLLLESALMGLFVAPPGLWLHRAPPPSPLAVFLPLWLLFRLQVESGAAKLLLGDPTWRDLTALVSYYETAPLPTWLGWWAHQLPPGVHRAGGAATYLVELGMPLLFWSRPAFRAVAFVAVAGFQLVILTTANYAFFNYLTLALALFLLDDEQLARVARMIRVRVRLAPPPPPRETSSVSHAVAVAAIVPLSLIPFLPFVPAGRALHRAAAPVRVVLEPFRSLNAYHLFAQMTLVRREVVIEGSNDGVTWEAYEFHYKPGDPRRPPRFVAPHQPRVDFQLWFLLLRRDEPPYFRTLLARLLTEPRVVAPLFAIDPFADVAPRLLRLRFYRYRFTDLATRRADGTWWQREPLGTSRVLDATALDAVNRP